ncbi:MAG TPA: hypothetical protein VHL57_12680 [Flavobacteriales bacterium]|jgi:hypothetical protein|nr:hypothetical protein [Flavobacteriales bacterium]
MRPFVLRALLFMLPVLLLLAAMERGLRRIPNDYSYKRTFWEQRPNDIHVLVLGSSHSFHDVDPSVFHDKGFNASHPSQSIDLDDLLFRTYAEGLDSLSFVIVPMAYNTLAVQLHTGIEAWRLKNYAIYYELPVSWWPGDHVELVQGTFKTQAKRLWDHWRWGANERTCTELGFCARDGAAAQLDLEQSGPEAAKRHTRPDRALFATNLGHVQDIIALAKQHRARVLLYTPPAYRTYREHLDPEQWRATQAAAQQLVEPGVVSYHDLLASAAFDSTDFHDADHLNTIGAHKLSAMLDSLMRTAR